MKCARTTILLALVSFLAYGQVGFSHKQKSMEMTSQKTESTERRLAACYEQMYQLMITKDTMALATMLADEFELVHITGVRQPKTAYLESIANGTLNYYHATTEHIAISMHGNMAEIAGQSRVLAAVFGGGRHTWPLQLRIMLRMSNGKWLMTRATASTY